MNKERFYKEVNKIEVPKNEVFNAIDEGMKKGRKEKKAKRMKSSKKQWLGISGAAAVIALSISLSNNGVIVTIPIVRDFIEKYISSTETLDNSSYKKTLGETTENELGKLTLNEVMMDDNQPFLSATFEPAKNVDFDYHNEEKNSSELVASDVNKPEVTINDIRYNEKLPGLVSVSGEVNISGTPVSTISEAVENSSEIVQLTIIDDGKQITFEGVDGGYITSKAKVDKVYKGSLNEGEIINVAEQGGVRQVEKQGQSFNIISLPEDNSQPLQGGDQAILFLYDNTDFSQIVGEKTYVRSVLFFSKYSIDPTSNTVQLASLEEYQLSEFVNVAVKTKKMKLNRFKNVDANLKYKEMSLYEFESYLPKGKDQ